MLVLSLVWFGIGLGMGLVSLLAHVQPVGWMKKPRELALLLLAGSAGCLGGWLGVWLFGRLFASVTALWVTGVLVLIIPWGVHACSHFCYNGKQI